MYDTISTGYAKARRADPRIAARIHDALGDATSVVNVGAGTGNYEPEDRRLVAIEPSGAMIAQRAAGAAPVVRGVAESLPLASGSADAAMALMTVHHWSDVRRGLREMARVAARQVLFVYDREQIWRLWAMDYFPEARDLPSERHAPRLEQFADVLDVTDVQTLQIPFDCTDGFGPAYWGRPEAYLDPAVQASMSWLALLEPPALARGTARLRHDLESGAWDERFGHLRERSEYDAGYRIVVAGAA